MSQNVWKGRESGLKIDAPIIVASLTLNILAMLTPLVILLIFDRVIPFQAVETLTMLTLILCGAAMLELVLRRARSTILNSAAEGIAVQNHLRFLKRITSANIREFAQLPAAKHFENYAAIARLRDHYSGQNQALAIDVPFTAIFIAMVALIGGWLVLVPLGSLLAVVAFAALMKSSQGSIFKHRKDLDERRYAFLSEVLSKVATVKSNTMERQMLRRFERLQDQTVATSERLIQFSGLAQSFGSILAQASIAAIGLFGAFLVIREMLGIAELAACMMLNGRIIQPLTRLITLWVQAELLSVSRRKLKSVDVFEPVASAGRPAQPLLGNIVFRNVMLRDGTDVAPFSSTVRAGSTVLVDTEFDWAMPALMDTITGQTAVASGSIQIDGLHPMDRHAERGTSALVALERSPAIFSGTVLDNISAFGDADQVERALHFARQLGLERRVFRLPAGYMTQLNDNSVFESDHVNRQLIALVRVLAMQPKLLLMNEPTRVLETTEREALSTCLSELAPRPTILMASPDPRMKRLADATLHILSPYAAIEAAWHADALDDAEDAVALSRGAA